MRLIPALQPIVWGPTNEVLAYEALARWCIDDQIFGPADLPCLPQWHAVDRGMMSAFHAHLANMNDVPRLFVNVGESTVESESYFSSWLDLVEELAKTAPYSIVIEITEGISDATLKRAWPRFRQLGLKLALDDFGEGSSSRARLIHYDWDYCKFESQTVHEPSTQSAIRYCKTSGILPVVERVDAREPSDEFDGMGLHWQQGFLHGKPFLLNELQERIPEDFVLT